MTTFREQCCIYTECVLSPLVTLLRKNKGTAGTSYVLGLPDFMLCCYYLVAGHSAPHLGWRDQLPPRSSHQGEERRCAPCVGIWVSHRQLGPILGSSCTAELPSPNTDQPPLDYRAQTQLPRESRAALRVTLGRVLCSTSTPHQLLQTSTSMLKKIRPLLSFFFTGTQFFFSFQESE